jgi:hypothetical protein
VKWSEEELEELDIMELEALMYCIFLKMIIDKGPRLVQGRRFVARNNNEPWVCACNSNDSNKPAIAVLLAWLHELMAIYSFAVELEWITSPQITPSQMHLVEERWFVFFALLLTLVFLLPRLL